ncbi:hypothetical protein ACQEUV_16995 [Micromonospora aurantiaca (nom. illeg.)]|uniref:hypothetical protein n=1 Tax=Micromonospora aurantiaca (nom. illeg.) TaxID=47850 RepID=UPI003DA22138
MAEPGSPNAVSTLLPAGNPSPGATPATVRPSTSTRSPWSLPGRLAGAAVLVGVALSGPLTGTAGLPQPGAAISSAIPASAGSFRWRHLICLSFRSYQDSVEPSRSCLVRSHPRTTDELLSAVLPTAVRPGPAC